MTDNYYTLIDRIVEKTLKGQISSLEYVYRLLADGLEGGTEDIFAQCLAERLIPVEAQFEAATDELKKAKAERHLKALKNIERQWGKWLENNATQNTIVKSIREILSAAPEQRLVVFLTTIDPNQTEAIKLDELERVAKELEKIANNKDFPPNEPEFLLSLARGITQALASWQQLQANLFAWVYDRPEDLGFADRSSSIEPWTSWSKYSTNLLLKQLFQSIGSSQADFSFDRVRDTLDWQDWVEFILILQFLPRGLVAWSEKQPYGSDFGRKLSISTFMNFVAIWSQLSYKLDRVTLPTSQRQQLSQVCFQVSLQLLRAFSQKPYFPLYGGIFAAISGGSLRYTLEYLDEPLRMVEGTQSKARILTLLGYSQRAVGRYDEAMRSFQEALEIARSAEDRACEIANLNHLSRASAAQKNYPEAVSYSQRALMLARSYGDSQGKANALVNLGYSEIFAAKQLDSLDEEVYERAIDYLQQGLKLAERGEDLQSQAIAYNSLGIAYITISQPEIAIVSLNKSIELAKSLGDYYLFGLSFAYIAEAYYSLDRLDLAIYTGCLGMYLLDQIGAVEWKQVAGLLIVIKGRVGDEFWQKSLQEGRSIIISIIGIDGYDYLPKLLEKYREV
jgi:tetratricopeptide (TPR) repeat protein